MYEVSTAYKNYIANNLERDYKVRLTVGTDVIDSDDIFSYSIETNQPSDKYTIGNAISQMLKIEIKNQEKPFYTNQLYLEIGMLVDGEYEYVPVGYFNVDKSEKKDHRTTLTCYDNMYKLEGLYVCELGNTKTVADILDDIDSKTGIQMSEDNYRNYTITDEIVGYSYREVVAMMAGLNGGNAYIDRTGKIKFVYLSDKTTKWAINDFYLFDGNSFKEQSYTIDKVTCYKDKDTSWSNGNLGTTPMTIEYENPFMTEAIAKDIYNKLANIEYQAFNMETMSYLALDVGDWISYTSQDNTVYSLCIQHYKFSGGIKQTLEAKTDGNKNNFNTSGSLTQKVNRTITDLLAAKKAIIGKANIEDLIAGKITFKTLNGETATIQDILTQFISGDNGQFLHLTGQNVVIDEAVIKDLIASRIKVSDLMAGEISTNKFNIVSDDGGIVIKGNTQQFKDKNGNVRLQVGRDAEGNFTFVVIGEDGTTAVYDQNGITKNAVPDGLIVNDMVADNANIDGSKVNIESLIECVNNNNTKTLNASKIVIDGTTQTMNVAFKQLTTTIDNLDATNKNLVTYNTDNWEQGVISASDGTEISTDRYLRLNSNNYIPVEVGKYTLTKYSNDFYLYCIYYDENKTFKAGFGLINDMNYTLNLSYKGFIRVEIKKADSSIITLPELKNYKFKLEKGGESTEFSYNPLDIGSLSQTLQTEFNVQQGQINQLIKDTTITIDGTEKKLKDAYNETRSTVDGTVQTISKMETQVNSLNLTNLLRAGGGDYLSVDGSIWGKGSFTSKDTFTLDGATNNKWYRIYNTNSNTESNSGMIYVTNSTKIKAPSDKKISVSFKYYCNDSNGKTDAINHIRLFVLQEHNNSNNFYNSYKYVDLDKTKASKLYKGTFELHSNCTRYMIRFDLANNAIASGVTTSFRFKDIMVVNGSVPANEWSPSFEDLQVDINSIESRVSSCEVKTTDEAFTVQVQKNQNRQFNVRYIRDYACGSTSGSQTHWMEIQAISNVGTNLALNKTVTSNVTVSNLSYITDGDYKDTTKYANASSSTTTVPYVQIDLGQVYTNIDEIKVWHYYKDGRKYNSTKTEISADGTHWVTLFDSAVSGTYVETVYGHSIKVNGTSFNSSQVVINELGEQIYNGALRIYNKAGTEVFGADTLGNLKFLGTMKQKDPTTGMLSVAIRNNGVEIYDWRNTGVGGEGDLVGGITATENTSSKRGATLLYSDIGNMLHIGYKDGPNNFSAIFEIDDTKQQNGGLSRASFYENVTFKGPNAIFADYADLRFYGNDYSVLLGNIGLDSSNQMFVVGKRDFSSPHLGYMEYNNSSISYKLVVGDNNKGTTVYGDFNVTGSKNRAVKISENEFIGMNAYETSSPYFGDIMEAEIPKDGLLYIPLDEKYLETVNTKYKYQVCILGIYGNENMSDEELKNLWCRCIKREEDYFVLKGSPGALIGIEVKALQKDYERDRLENIEIGEKNVVNYADLDKETEIEKEENNKIEEISLNDYNSYLEKLEMEMLNYD